MQPIQFHAPMAPKEGVSKFVQLASLLFVYPALLAPNEHTLDEVNKMCFDTTDPAVGFKDIGQAVEDIRKILDSAAAVDFTDEMVPDCLFSAPIATSHTISAVIDGTFKLIAKTGEAVNPKYVFSKSTPYKYDVIDEGRKVYPVSMFDHMVDLVKTMPQSWQPSVNQFVTNQGATVEAEKSFQIPLPKDLGEIWAVLIAGTPQKLITDENPQTASVGVHVQPGTEDTPAVLTAWLTAEYQDRQEAPAFFVFGTEGVFGGMVDSIGAPYREYPDFEALDKEAARQRALPVAQRSGTVYSPAVSLLSPIGYDDNGNMVIVEKLGEDKLKLSTALYQLTCMGVKAYLPEKLLSACETAMEKFDTISPLAALQKQLTNPRRNSVVKGNPFA